MDSRDLSAREEKSGAEGTGDRFDPARRRHLAPSVHCPPARRVRCGPLERGRVRPTRDKKQGSVRLGHSSPIASSTDDCQSITTTSCHH